MGFHHLGGGDGEPREYARTRLYLLGCLDGGLDRGRARQGDSDPSRDPHRVQFTRDAIGDRGLFVDANGPYTVKQALQLPSKAH